ncbi:hypothetical protein [Cryobacterium sp. CG_9.6]|uniref:hypothetical protein n=1 Tax=Cryobacterium sp. CG_9.6 TaxID=2760710 RepID=UPI0024749EA4|nr:hypothetical protein [Cryobacterium sp. CG_9.6]MDH6236266.1 hypothetical protein [Cryobacterium sp. CG_9.6]
MNTDKSKFWQVQVDMPKNDKDGNAISPDSWSSGGARNADGSLIMQYSNPRVLGSAGEPQSDRGFDERSSRKNSALRRREYDAEERRREDNRVMAGFLRDEIVIPLMRNVLLPAAAKWWDTTLRPEGKRFAQRVFRPKSGSPESSQESGDTTIAADAADSLATSRPVTDHLTEASAVQEHIAGAAIAEVIQIDQYQNRRSA